MFSQFRLYRQFNRSVAQLVPFVLTTLAALAYSSTALAAPWFEVEVYVFERTSGSAEQWPDEVKAINTAKAIDLISPVIGQQTVLAAEVSCDPSEVLAQTCVEQAPLTQFNYPQQVPVDVVAASVSQPTLTDTAVLAAQSQNRFNDIVRTLSRESGNRSLLHMTWQQAMQPRHKAIPIRLFAGQNFGERFAQNGISRTDEALVEQPYEDNASGQTDTRIGNEYASLVAASAASTVPMQPKINLPVWQLDGTINIYLSHYLYIETNLGLRKAGQKRLVSNEMQNDMQSTSTPVTTDFLYAVDLAQNRRVRSGEIHYFDHPNMGIVMQIRKMAQPQGEPTPTDIAEDAEDENADEVIEPDEPPANQ